MRPLLLNYRSWHFDTAVIYNNYENINFEDYNLFIYAKDGQTNVMFNESNNPKYKKDVAQKTTKTSEYTCYYNLENSLKKPLSIQCQINKIFLKKRNFKYLYRSEPYVIFENINKPIIWD